MITNLIQSSLSDSPDENNPTDENSPEENQTVATSSDSVATSSSKGNMYSLKDRVTDYWQRTSLRRKTSLVALAIGVLPIAVVGGVAHHLAVRSLMQQIISDQESRTFDIGQKVSLFTNHVISDAETIANSPLLKDPQLNGIASEEQKVTMLDDFIQEHPSERYDSIAVFDPNGKLLFQSGSANPLDANVNYGKHDYFQRAISTKTAVVNDPEIHSASSKNTLVVAAPIEENDTGKILGVVCLRMPLSHWKQIFKYVQAESWEYKLIDSESRIFDADEMENVGRPAGIDLEDLPQLQAKIQTQQKNSNRNQPLSATQVMEDKDDKEQVLVTLSSIPETEGISPPGWMLALSHPLDRAFAPLRQLRWTILIGTGSAALLVGAIATALANRAILPILAASEAVRKIGQGELDTYLEVRGQDELAVLETNVNKMAQKLRNLVDYQAAETERSQQLKDLTLKLSRALNSEEVFQMAVEEIRKALAVHRAAIYSLEPGGKGRIVAESTAENWSSLLEAESTELDYLDEYIANKQSNKVRAISNIYQADLEVNHLKQLAAFSVKAKLIAPFSTGKKTQNLLILHQCDAPRQWQQAEIDFFAQLTSQLVLAWERTNLLQQQQTARQELQERALELLMEVEPISQGDLTPTPLSLKTKLALLPIPIILQLKACVRL